MFPESDLTLEAIETLSSVSTTLGKVFLFDFDTRQYVLVNGKPVEATYEQAIKQWISFLLTTELSTYKIHEDTGFGLSLKQFIGRRDIDKSIIESEVERQIEEKLIMHPEISSIEDVAITRDGSKATVSFKVVTSQGVTISTESEVLYSDN